MRPRIEIELWQADTPHGPEPILRALVSEFATAFNSEDATAVLAVTVHWDDGTQDQYDMPVWYTPEFERAIKRTAFDIHQRALTAVLK